MRTLLIILLLFPLFSFSQSKIEKGTNTINVIGITFKQAAESLLDAGFYIEKTDSIFQTIKTEFKTGTGKNKWMKLRLFVRVKDSTAIITGQWYNSIFIGSKLFGIEQTIENNTSKIKYSSGNEKNCFMEMNSFALSFKRQTQYLIVD